MKIKNLIYNIKNGHAEKNIIWASSPWDHDGRWGLVVD